MNKSNEEKAKEITKDYAPVIEILDAKTVLYDAVMEMAEWKEQQMIEKALNWIHDNLCYYDEDGFDADGNGILGDLKKAMEE